MFKKILASLIATVSILAAAPGAALIEVDTIKKGEVNPLQKFVGTVSFDKKSTLASQSSGLVKTVTFEVGDAIKKGKVLIKIDSELLDAKIKSFMANLEISNIKLKNANKDFLRYKRLIETKSITAQEFDTSLLEFNSAEQNVISLKAQLKELKIQKAQKIVYAPFDGIIVEKNINIGEWASEGKSVATLVNTSSIEIIFNLPANLVSGLKSKKIYDIKISNKILKAKFHSAIPKGDKLTRTFPVKFKADVKDMFVFDGQEASVNLAKNAKMQSLIINRDAVINRFGNQVVFVNNKGAALMIPVKILGYLGKDIAIAGKGLVEGMSVVVKGNERVFPNQPVQVIKN
ncbi:MAG: efflux RND transporter periplasmic adaptor subunit [Campylobacteraceae bacterium]|nr:efflux RND transporter periplasmic adaptor subunit [Campylobacteraceae bacterium]